ncbi:glycoside hydrolase family 97 protein [Candidatus Saccharibacteria bacterium]|nr:glycoside hydrolase family 97 protein [Candidatus Saccharibacteria bacterium]
MAFDKKKFLKWFEYFRRPSVDVERNIKSPDGRVALKFSVRQGHISYSVTKDERTIIRESRLGIKLKGSDPLGDYLSLVRTTEKTVSTMWETVWGEDHFVTDSHSEVTFYLAETSGKKRLFTLRFRVFNDGVAFRYELPPQPEFFRVEIEDELTEFNIDLNAEAWKIPAYQPDRYEYNYEKVPVYDLEKSVHTPLTIHLRNDYYISLHEAALYNYGEMTLKLDEWKALKSDITPLSDGIKARVELPWSTPWRVVMIADRAIDLVKNRITLNLNDPPKEDFSWVLPIKFIGVWWAMYVGEWTWSSGPRHGATTEHAREYIDAARRLGLGGVLLEGWNGGWDGDWLKNGKTTDFITPMPDCNLPAVAAYARQNGIELIGHHETVGFVDNYEKQLEATYDACTKLGIRYIKPGYAGSMMEIDGKREYHHSQLGVLHYQHALELAAKYHICLDVHEPIKGTGIERTFPNLLTREGARGQEYEGGAISPSHACILPFTRLLAGAMDYTPGIFDIENATKRLSSTLARQLAYFVTIPSGMQMAADRPRFYEQVNPAAFKFIRDVPVNWERTHPLMGKIGEYYVVARRDRRTSDWYVGGVTNESSHKVRVLLPFLGDGNYTAEIYRDGDSAHYRDNPLEIKIETASVTRNNYIDIWMAPGGGFAIRLRKS